MRGLFLKIFAIFWVAQSLIFVITTALILEHRRLPPEAMLDVLQSPMHEESKVSVAAYESGGCAALESYAVAHEQRIVLEDQRGKNVCSAAAKLQGAGASQEFVASTPVESATGHHYLFLIGPLHVPPPPGIDRGLLHFAFPQLLVAIAVGGVTTFVLVLLFTRPLVRLRKAAAELAQGNLGIRLREKTPAAPPGHHRDEFEALVHDFNVMAGRLESMVDAQRLLLRDVSHELRSPLARLTVALELARDDAETNMVPHLDRIERETERLNQLIGQLLTLSSMEGMEKGRAFELLSLNNLIEDMIPDAQYEAGQRNCTIALLAEGEFAIRGNRELLYRALENIVRNAIRYTAPGSEVEVRLASGVLDGSAAAAVEVRDRGPGIPQDEMKAIFHPFYRIDNARSSDTGGFGVGLAIAERAVRLHQGSIEAVNRTGGGSTIRILLLTAAYTPPDADDKGSERPLTD